MFKFSTLLFLSLSLSLPALASPKACGDENLTTIRGTEVPMGILGLPKMMFVARTADFVVATLKDKKPVRIHARQSFTTAKTDVVCADSGFPEGSYAIYAPTLINFSANSSQANSVWQFQLMANKNQLGIWNTRSRLQSSQQDLSSVENQAGAQVQVFQTEHDRYELVIQRQVGESKEVLKIQFDAI
jgi:hypothetical protein